VSKAKGDLFGALTAAIIALPLALAFGVASGAGPIAGLYGAIAVGFFASVFGGTPTQISGPTGPMTIVMGAIVATHAQNLSEAFTIVVLGGLLQIGFGWLRLGKYIVYTPYSVVSGFMTGIGLIIMIIQLPAFVGISSSAQNVFESLRSVTTLDLAALDWTAFAVSAASLGLIVVWPSRLHRVLPAPLTVLVVGTLVSSLLPHAIPQIGAVPSGLPSMIVPNVSVAALPMVVQGAFVLALLGSIDTLLTSLVADSITRTQHDSDKELVGQGIGNCIAGLLGALPGAGATMRTLVNIRAGGSTAVSGVLHALMLLVIAIGLGPVVSHVPHAVLAAILMKVGWDIIDWGYLRRARGAPREKFVIMLVTLGLTVFVDLITAVAVGIILSSFVNSRWLAAEQLKGLKQSSDDGELEQFSLEERALLQVADGKILVTVLHGSFSYASARELARRATPTDVRHEIAIYDFSGAAYIDTSAALAIDELIDLTQRSGKDVLIAGLQGNASKVLEGLGVLQRVPSPKRFSHRLEAIQAAVAAIRTDPGAPAVESERPRAG
jgi:SulP family sulfate permease